MPTHRRTWLGLAVAALVAAACSEGAAPELSNPQQLTSDLQTVSAVFATPTFQSFGALANAPGSPVAATAPAGALLGAARVAAPQGPRQPYADAPARLQALRAAASGMTATGTTGVIPSALWGKTYVWQDGTGYVEDPAQFDASRQGIRVILYQVDETGNVIEPSSAVGYVDLIDASSGNTNALHLTVTGGTPSAPGLTYADYTVSGSVTLNGLGQVAAFSASAVGDVSDGTRTLHFEASISATNLDTDNPDAQVDVTWSLDTPPVSVALHETLATSDVDHATITINFSVTRGGETVAISATITVAPEGVTAHAQVTIGGQLFARITVAPNGSDIRKVNGQPLSQDEVAALQALFLLPDQFEKVFEDLFHPAEHLMGG